MISFFFPPEFLSQRECEVAWLLARGLSSKQVARLLHISASTACKHRENVLRKFGVNSTAALAAALYRRVNTAAIR